MVHPGENDFSEIVPIGFALFGTPSFLLHASASSQSDVSDTSHPSALILLQFGTLLPAVGTSLPFFVFFFFFRAKNASRTSRTTHVESRERVNTCAFSTQPAKNRNHAVVMPSMPALPGFLLFFLCRSLYPRARARRSSHEAPRAPLHHKSSSTSSTISDEDANDLATEDADDEGDETEAHDEEREANWAGSYVAALPEMWALIAQHSGLVGAWRLKGVCQASRQGADEFLRTLPGLVVSGGIHAKGMVGDVWRLRPRTLHWEHMPSLLSPTLSHTCCVVRGALVVFSHHGDTSSVEMLASDEGEFTKLPSLSCGGGIRGTTAIAVDESDSAMGQVMLLGAVQGGNTHTTVHLVDVATGMCTPQPDLLHARNSFAAARLPDGRVICAGGLMSDKVVEKSAEIWGPAPEQPRAEPSQQHQDRQQDQQQGNEKQRSDEKTQQEDDAEEPRGTQQQDAAAAAPAPAWTWRDVPAMSMGRNGCCGCVLSDGRFAVFGGTDFDGYNTSSCEVLNVNDGDAGSWAPLPAMHDSRTHFACAAVAGCVVVAGGFNRKTADVFDEKLGRWFRLPHNVPCADWLGYMGSNMPLL